ncbi:hypothetical protein RJ640_025618 [Escallonia rubra]|uniref:Pentatricopeptide repeat-containing protein-mitochondrial domain-containing protein n=1 Tax=Escallonia rubra TaxID=112253 RepID=A0AA88UUG2_9ASTE|nr:hypothetical protein RJ640_025618 [Escallonia rubra]
MGVLIRSSSADYQRIVPHDPSLEFGSVYGQEKDDFDVGSLKKKLPPWRNVSTVQQTSDFQTGVASQPLRVSERTITDENELHFLEERDEDILSKRILTLSRSNKVKSALELFSSMKFSGLKPNLHACNSLLSCLLRNEKVDEALRIFECMKASEMTTAHTCSLILKATADARGTDAALDMFEELVQISNIRKDFDAVVYNTMISACAKVNDWVQAEKIWKSLTYDGHVGTTITYRLLVCLFVRCGQNELALDAYREMIQNGLKPAVDAMQAIIGACAKEGNWDLALSVFQEMLNSGLKPNIIACNALINSLGKAGKVNLAFKVYGLMKSLGLLPDAYTWNALLGALYRANRHADALRLFEDIQIEQCSVLNTHLYNTALMSCQRLGLWDRALQVLWQMEDSGLSVSTTSYNIVIGACEVARRPEVALQVYEHMVHQKHAPDTFTLLSLVRSCIWRSLWDEVEEILNRASPNGSLYNTAIQGMCLKGKIDSAKKLYKRMGEHGLKADGKTRAMMLQNLPKNSIRRAKR